ncbi:anthocyanidin 3-O-glucosyltransferase 2-like [Salvia hispanica]|uniref:anthocyanidin 3-O-glucosyltransferase 2-like n=1 Tax=Salvia hispanica TaxID=49212 RepID=UPI0020092335|nr:anthocyanidin 3-O-glucosyltransferase 2-like [Salvia hispanica]
MNKSELVFIPCPALSHLIPTIETAKLLLLRDSRLSATVFLPPHIYVIDTIAETYLETTSSNPTFSSRLKFIRLPPIQHSNKHFFEHYNVQIPNVRREISNLLTNEQNPRLAAIVLDIFCVGLVSVAAEFGLPAYLFFTGGATCLGIYQHFVSLRFDRDEDVTRYKNTEVDLPVPCFSLPVPAKVLPMMTVDETSPPGIFLTHFKMFSEVKGILINTFYDMEPYAVESLLSDDKTPEIYPVGPVLKVESKWFAEDDDVKKWLDDQPENSVVFLCFGSLGIFGEEQVREIAKGLENSGTRFLWSLRKSYNPKIERERSEYFEGFSERTKGFGRVMEWAPQAAVLAHPAVGGFVSHCGWNSTLESVWFGVPMATFPMHAEQQLNAFYLVKEMGMAEAITLDYQMDFTGEKPPESVGWEVIAGGIRRLMEEEGGSGVRRKVEEMRKKAREALVEGGSSYNALTRFIEDVMTNVD